MKVFLLLSVWIVVSTAAPILEEAQAKIIKYDNLNDGRGNYDFSFETSNGIKRSESGVLVDEGQPGEYIKVSGFYSYTDSEGNIVEIKYTADEDGYQIISLPPLVARPPLVPVQVATPPHVVASLLGG